MQSSGLVLTVLLSLLSDGDTCPEIPDSSWSLELDTSPGSSVLAVRWEVETLTCPQVMFSVLGPREEVVSLPVSSVTGSVRLPVQFTCDLLHVRLATLAPGDTELSYISSNKILWIPAHLSTISSIPTTIILSLPPSC